MLADIIRDWGGTEVTALDMYGDIFHLGDGYLQSEGEAPGQFKANPIGYYKNEGEATGHFRILFEDTFSEILAEVQQGDFSLLNCVTYYGRHRTQDKASKMYAMIFDLDGVDDKHLRNFLSGSIDGDWYPVPNYLVLSGHNVHLYYVFEEPLSLYPNIRLQLKELKYALTDKIWNRYTSSIDKVQKQGIFQPFRVVGGKTKADAPDRVVRAFRLNLHPFDLTKLCSYVDDKYLIDPAKVYKETKYSLEQARNLFPEWYEKVVVGKDKTPKAWDIAGKVHGSDPYALYHWWLGQIDKGAAVGHRYFCVMCLAIYAVKNDVSFEQLRDDAYALVPRFNAMDLDHPFTQSDVDSALECFDERYRTFPRHDIASLSAIPIIPNKRNGRKQVQHLAGARAIQEINDKFNGTNWRDGNGRPAKELVVLQWQLNHPDGTKAECVKQTGLSKPTVYKWWDSQCNEKINNGNGRKKS